MKYKGKIEDAKDLTTKEYVDGSVQGKQDKLTTQTAYTAKGTSTKVPQITTNSLGQVTGITEVAIETGAETDPIFTASAAHGITSGDISNWNGKQDSISDLSTIRSGASAGATAVQPGANVSALTNDAGYLTLSTLPIWDGGTR